VNFDLYVWHSPRDLEGERAEALIESWEKTGGDPGTSPFEPSTDVGWFHRELTKDEPLLETVSDAVPNRSTTPIWLSGSADPPARVVAIRLPAGAPVDALDTIFGLAMKYDLLLFDARIHRIHRPLDEMAAHASATFWPRGAIRAAVAGGAGGVVAVVIWLLGIPVVSGLVALAGAFMFVMAVYSFIHEVRKAVKSRRT
jgi:hypothetical protein